MSNHTSKRFSRKRDMELIRLLLLEAESDTDVSEALKRYSDAQQVYHLALLKDAGYIDARILNDQEGFPDGAAVTRLTWRGHEFLDLTRDDKVWAFVKKKILKSGVSWTTSILIEALKAEAKRRLGAWIPNENSST